MPTIKPRINISLPDDIRNILNKLAKRDRIPAATKAARLLEKALELEEDQIWDEIAKKRDKKRARFLSPSKVWK